MQTIYNLKTRYATTGSVTDRPRSGRPRATSCRDNRFITFTHLRNRFTQATVTAQRLGISDETIRNRLRQYRAPIRARRPYTGQILLAQNGVKVLPWPAVSPNQKPIDHFWEKLGHRVRNNHQINNVNDLRHAPLVEGQNIPNDVIRRLTNSIRRRISTCFGAKGGHTRY
jgi:hypothetical protein